MVLANGEEGTAHVHDPVEVWQLIYFHRQSSYGAHFQQMQWTIDKNRRGQNLQTTLAVPSW